MNSMVDITSTERKLADRIDAGVTQQLVVSDTGTGVAFGNVGEMMEFAKMMAVANSGVRKHLRGNPGACLAILTQSLEWGLSPFAVANKSYFVNDQIAFESQLVQAVILKRAPIKGRIKFEYRGEGQTRVCRAWARLREDDEIVDYVSPAIRDIKVQNSPLWKTDPDQQLAYYSGRSLCRRHFPDVLLGIFADDEIERGPAVGADRARDVTPKSLGGKLDALAAAPARKHTIVEEAFVEHDPETGEITGQGGAGEASGADAAAGGQKVAAQQEQTGTADQQHSQASAAGVDQKPTDPARTGLLNKLHGKAGLGTQKLRMALGGLRQDEEAMLTDADHDELGGLAEAADEKASR